MDDFRIKTSFRINPKRERLRRLLGDAGIVALVDLWAFTALEKTDGDLSGMDDIDIEIAAGWRGDDGEFIATLAKLRFLDGESGAYAIHDWDEINPYVYGHKERSAKAKKAAVKRWDKPGSKPTGVRRNNTKGPF